MTYKVAAAGTDGKIFIYVKIPLVHVCVLEMSFDELCSDDLAL